MVSHIVSDTAEITHWHTLRRRREARTRWLHETQLIGKRFGRRIDQGGKYPLQCFSAVNNTDSRPLWKVASVNVSLAKVSKLTTWARLEPISYQHLLLTRKAISVGWFS